MKESSRKASKETVLRLQLEDRGRESYESLGTASAKVPGMTLPEK